jgi:hypothetical protein
MLTCDKCVGYIQKKSHTPSITDTNTTSLLFPLTSIVVAVSWGSASITYMMGVFPWRAKRRKYIHRKVDRHKRFMVLGLRISPWWTRRRCFSAVTVHSMRVSQVSRVLSLRDIPDRLRLLGSYGLIRRCRAAHSPDVQRVHQYAWMNAWSAE